MTLTGAAADDIGVVGVAVAVQDRVSKQWLQADGSFGLRATRLKEAALADPGDTSTRWSYTFDPQRSGDFGVQAQSFDASGNESTKVWRRFAITG